MKEGYKRCTKCGLEKPVGEFSTRIHSIDGYRKNCRECQNLSKRLCRQRNLKKYRAYGKKWRSKNKEYEKEHKKQYYAKNSERHNFVSRLWAVANPDKIAIITARWRRNNPEKERESWMKYARLHPDKVRAKCKNYYIKNRTKILAKWKIWYKKNRKAIIERIKKRRSTPKGALDARMHMSIGQALRGKKNGRQWNTLVGYTVEDLKKHLEALFVDGMSWDNMGQWHIDHVAPQSKFHYETAESPEFKVCWSLANLQPLWAKDNLSKRDRTMEEWKAAK